MNYFLSSTKIVFSQISINLKCEVKINILATNYPQSNFLSVFFISQGNCTINIFRTNFEIFSVLFSLHFEFATNIRVVTLLICQSVKARILFEAVEGKLSLADGLMKGSDYL